nr:MAG TPA: hypothetical protein [Crassvirales sp.]DAN01170.1 MAG TPA: hypothetical protein [Crassvirales sp.]
MDLDCSTTPFQFTLCWNSPSCLYLNIALFHLASAGLVGGSSPNRLYKPRSVSLTE